ncbi:retrotransposon protein, putative, ty1-copia subclass [Tanacetum coccineum]|uniref:Retrotransposon protein, putative, ty1-copia subclass n=1 Tax=Tanacetum coccineum TaxID=301880 RepID=A0ABQ5F5B2_9ASTR
MAQPKNNNTLSSAFKTFFEREKLTSDNFNDWYRSLRIVLRVAGTYDYLYKPCPDEPPENVVENVKAAWKAEYKIHSDVACLMLGKMSPALQRQFELYFPQAMLNELRKMFEKPQAVEIYDLVDTLHSCKQAPRKSISAHVLEMKGYMDQLQALGKPYDNDMAINLINRSLNKDFVDFVRNFNMHCVGKTVSELHALLIDYEKGLKDKAPTPQLVTGRGTALFTSKSCAQIRTRRLGMVPQLQEFRVERKLSYGEQYLHVGNGAQAAVEAIGVFNLVLPSGLVLSLNNCHYAPSIIRGVVSFSRLLDLGFVHTVTSNGISVSSNGIFYFSAISVNGVFEIDMNDNVSKYNNNSIFSINKKRKLDLNSSYLWHCRLAHIGKTRMQKLQREGLLENLLGLIHTDVCGPLRHVSRKGASYFLTFTDDFSRYGYVYLLKHKHESGEYLSQEFKEYLVPLESAVRILNMVPTKKVDKTPYEIWHGKAPNLSYLKMHKGRGRFAHNWSSNINRNPEASTGIFIAVKHILKYLRNTRDMFLVYGGKPDAELNVTGFCDASCQCDKDDMKSQTSYVFVVNGGAEFVGDLGVMPSIKEPINMYCDNSAAIIFAKDSGIMKGARHFLRRYHFVREQVESGEIKILKVIHRLITLAIPIH